MSFLPALNIYSECQQFLTKIGFTQEEKLFTYNNSNISIALTPNVTIFDLKVIIVTFFTVLKLSDDVASNNYKCNQFISFQNSISDIVLVQNEHIYTFTVVAKHMASLIQELKESEVYDNNLQEIVNQFFNVFKLF